MLFVHPCFDCTSIPVNHAFSLHLAGLKQKPWYQASFSLANTSQIVIIIYSTDGDGAIMYNDTGDQ